MKSVYYKGKAWKHHRAEDFIKNPSLMHPNGVGKGGTIFLDYNKMIRYLENIGGDWYVCELMLNNDLVILNHSHSWMVDVDHSISSEKGFKPL